MKEAWTALFSNKRLLFIWFFCLFITLLLLKACSLYLIFNEARETGALLDDVFLNALTPQDVSKLLFGITWVCIFSGLPVALRTPHRALLVFLSISTIIILRCICMYLVPLQPPEGIIPLRDTFLEQSFYDDNVLLKDLFFSGHTANLALLTFLVDVKWMKRVLVLATLVVAFLLLKQHVHYTIDVVAAPFFAFISYRIAAKILDFIKSWTLSSQTENTLANVVPSI